MIGNDGDIHSLLVELDEEHGALEAVLLARPEAAWDAPTPSEGWAVRDQIGHLTWFDEQARIAAVDPEGFVAALEKDLEDWPGYMARAAALGRDTPAPLLFAAWQTARGTMLDALDALPEGTRLPWYGPSMSVRSFATARLMETWAHGQDVCDALDAERPPSDRLRHICHLGFITRGWSYTVRGATAPDTPVRVTLSLPSGAEFVAGPPEATDVVRGMAEDFCLVVTQRRHVSDTALEVQGDAAAGWMAIAQCFAGAATLAEPRG